MIVVDTNVIAYAVIPGAKTATALATIAQDPEWVAPPLWRSEFRNVLATSVRTKRLTLSQALAAWEHAVGLIAESDLAPDCGAILRLSAATGASAYDCEYVVLAQTLGVPLVTADNRLARRFPDVVVAMDHYRRAGGE
jgi:predicted nucleic acid-binding protein